MRASDRQLMAEQGLDEDPALSEPRILQHADDFMALDRKLQRVASDPDMNPPAASSSSANVEADANTEAGLNERAADPEDPLQGIKLKRKPSTNFGAPLGQLR